MEVSESEFAASNLAGQRTSEKFSCAVRARFDKQTARLVIDLASGVELAVPTHLVEGLHEAAAAKLSDIEITPSGLGLHFPQLDADV